MRWTWCARITCLLPVVVVICFGVPATGCSDLNFTETFEDSSGYVLYQSHSSSERFVWQRTPSGSISSLGRPITSATTSGVEQANPNANQGYSLYADAAGVQGQELATISTGILNVGTGDAREVCHVSFSYSMQGLTVGSLRVGTDLADQNSTAFCRNGPQQAGDQDAWLKGQFWVRPTSTSGFKVIVEAQASATDSQSNDSASGIALDNLTVSCCAEFCYNFNPVGFECGREGFEGDWNISTLTDPERDPSHQSVLHSHEDPSSPVAIVSWTQHLPIDWSRATCNISFMIKSMAWIDGALIVQHTRSGGRNPRVLFSADGQKHQPGKWILAGKDDFLVRPIQNTLQMMFVTTAGGNWSDIYIDDVTLTCCERPKEIDPTANTTLAQQGMSATSSSAASYTRSALGPIVSGSQTQSAPATHTEPLTAGQELLTSAPVQDQAVSSATRHIPTDPGNVRDQDPASNDGNSNSGIIAAVSAVGGILVVVAILAVIRMHYASFFVGHQAMKDSPSSRDTNVFTSYANASMQNINLPDVDGGMTGPRRKSFSTAGSDYHLTTGGRRESILLPMSAQTSILSIVTTSSLDGRSQSSAVTHYVDRPVLTAEGQFMHAMIAQPHTHAANVQPSPLQGDFSIDSPEWHRATPPTIQRIHSIGPLRQEKQYKELLDGQHQFTETPLTREDWATPIHPALFKTDSLTLNNPDDLRHAYKMSAISSRNISQEGQPRRPDTPMSLTNRSQHPLPSSGPGSPRGSIPASAWLPNAVIPTCSWENLHADKKLANPAARQSSHQTRLSRVPSPLLLSQDDGVDDGNILIKCLEDESYCHYSKKKHRSSEQGVSGTRCDDNYYACRYDGVSIGRRTRAGSLSFSPSEKNESSAGRSRSSSLAIYADADELKESAAKSIHPRYMR
eukprot:scpid30700/ scgid31895/ 